MFILRVVDASSNKAGYLIISPLLPLPPLLLYYGSVGILMFEVDTLEAHLILPQKVT